jgi:signal transduction histidine kinase
MEYRLRRADGQYRWVLDRGSPRFEPDGRFAGFIGSCVDITERKTLEADLRRAIRTRDVFLSVASHELRTPLTSLQLQVDMFARTLSRRAEEALASGRLGESARKIAAQVLRLSELVDVLLDVSRIASGRLELNPEDLDLVKVVQGTVDRWGAVALQAGCALTFVAPASAPGRWDRLRIEQVLGNLLSNALKYGAGAPVEVEVAALDERVRLRVSDRGIGIAAGDQSRIFERFERAASPNHYGGLGLGLWIAHEIVVEAMGGTLTVTSAPGQGATFVVTLPRISPQHPPRDAVQ